VITISERMQQTDDAWNSRNWDAFLLFVLELPERVGSG